jgi:hypothetical protein
MTEDEFNYFKDKKETLIYVRPNGIINDILFWDNDGTGTRIGNETHDEELMNIHGYAMKFLIKKRNYAKQKVN